MSISFKEFSNLLEKKSGTFGGKTSNPKTVKDTSLKSKTAKSPDSKAGGKNVDKLDDKLVGKSSLFGKGGKTPGKKDKKDKKDTKVDPMFDKTKKDKEDKKDDEKDDATFGGIPLTKRTDAEKDKKQREIQDKKRRAGLDKYHTQRKKDKEEKEKRIASKKQKQASNAVDDKRTDQQRAQDTKKDADAIKKEKDKEDRLKKSKPKYDDSWKSSGTSRMKKVFNQNSLESFYQFEASRKANKLHIMHSAKQIGKIKDSEERERQAKDLEKKAKKMGFGRAEIEKILDDQGAYGEEYAMKKTMEEAEKMHSYMNTLSLERTANIWSEAAKKDEDLDPVQGSKTLTKKTQEKVTINPMEKQAIRKG